MADAGAARSSPASGSESSEDSRAGDGERAAGKAKSEEKATASTYKRSSTSPSLVARRYWWTSVSNWFAILENKTKKYVRRHLLISWLLLLLFLYVLALFNVIFLPSAIEAYPFLLRLGQPGYLALVSLNMLLIVCSALAVALRSVTYVRLACQAMLPLCFLLTLPLAWSMMSQRCECLDWPSCYALQGYTQNTILNPFPMPPDVESAFGLWRNVPYQPPPKQRRLVHPQKIRKSKRTASMTSMRDLSPDSLIERVGRPVEAVPEAMAVATSATGEISLLSPRGRKKQPPGSLLMPSARASAVQTGQHGAAARPLSAGRHMSSRPSTSGSGQKRRAMKRAEEVHPFWNFWWITSHRIKMMSEDNEVAYMPLAEGEDATKLAQQLDVIVSKFSCTSLNTFAVDFGRKECLINSENWPQLDVRIWKKIWACLDVEDCGAVEVAVLDGSDGHPPALKIVTHYLDLYPAPRADSDEEEAAGSGSAFFLKKIDAVGQDVFANDAKVLRALYTELKRSSMPGIEPLVTMQTPVGCRCDQDSCMQYTDSGGSLVAWCRISEDMLEHCLDANGVKVYKSHDPVAKTSFLWSPDLCRTRCSCSGIGMLGRAQADEDLTEMGEKCTSAGDPEGMKWCNVGVDSTCPDRDKTRPVFAEVPPAMRQFTSEVACLAENESPKSAVSARGVCVTVVSSIGLAIFMGTLTYLVVLYFLGRYLAIGCGDYVVAQTNQFEVTFDSD